MDKSEIDTFVCGREIKEENWGANKSIFLSCRIDGLNISNNKKREVMECFEKYVAEIRTLVEEGLAE